MTAVKNGHVLSDVSIYALLTLLLNFFIVTFAMTNNLVCAYISSFVYLFVCVVAKK